MWPLDDRFVRALPGDPESGPRVRQVQACWSEVPPTPVRAPTLLAVADEVAPLVGLTPAQVREPALVEVLAGNRVPPGARPYAACYGGHQFGHWAGQLGDGRAITLGEATGSEGPQEVQLKGAGPTPYSRSGDGRAVLRSSIREFLCSEAMHHLGIPTTRALALVGTGEPVVRDLFYDGRPKAEPGAVVTRVAPSFLRFGSFEIHAAREDTETLAALVEHTLATWFPALGPPGPAAAVAMVAEIGARSARLVAEWQRVGFVHGVLNTDNLSILGLTIDYGPYGWLEPWDPDWTPNTTDAGQRRYRFGNQPAVVGWNLSRLAGALLPLVGEVAPLQEALDHFSRVLATELRTMQARKLGLRGTEPEDDTLLAGLGEVLRVVETDHTLFFRHLAEVDPTAGSDDTLLAPLEPAFYAPPPPPGRARVARWLRAWAARVRQDDGADRVARMRAANPRYVPRNWLVQQVIDRAERGDPTGIGELLEVLRRPYDDQPGREAFAARRPEWARDRAGCSMLSCSS